MNALGDEGWHCSRLTIDDTGLITPERIEAERRAGMSEGKIRQEFHCSFEAENGDQLIPYAHVEAAMERAGRGDGLGYGEKVIGVDVARFGDDKSVIFFRQGRDGSVLPYERHAGWDTMQLAARVADWIQRWYADAVFIDDGGVGGGVVDRLHHLGFRSVHGVNFGGRSDYGLTRERASNKRTEMWLSARHWLAGGALPKDARLAAELAAPMYRYDANNALVLEPKAEMRKRGIPSPDIADALALTFAYPFMPY